jgi:GT2 family glycosyltransferase
MRSPSSTEAVDVIVVTRDRFSTFARCLDAVYHHTHLPCSLFVVAGAVDRATEEHLRRVQATKGNVSLLLENRHLTQAEARNLGLAQARSRYCVVLENDTMMHDNWLAPMLECMREQRAAAVMPLIFWYRGLHAAGCTFEELDVAGRRELRHRILYGDIRRKPIARRSDVRGTSSAGAPRYSSLQAALGCVRLEGAQRCLHGEVGRLL